MTRAKPRMQIWSGNDSLSDKHRWSCLVSFFIYFGRIAKTNDVQEPNDDTDQ